MRPLVHYQDTPATAAELREWFAGLPVIGLGIVAGPVSGIILADGRPAGLEFLDFDDPETHERFVTQLRTRGGGALWERLPCEETPTGGWHYGYLCVESGASTTLARRPGVNRQGRAVMVPTIELRGRGSLCVVAPTPPGVHPTHPERNYGMARGSWTVIPLITPEARQHLLDGARALFRRPDIALACAAVLGLPVDGVGRGFACILPGHAEDHPSASLHWDPKTGALQYHDWHARSDVAWYTLPDARTSVAHREAVRLRGPSVATWQLRLLIEAGVLTRYPVPAPPLPSVASLAARQVYEGFLLLLACKWWHTSQAPAPFSWRFAAAWCGLGARQAGAALRWLLAQGVLRQVGTHRRTALFLPGAGPAAPGRGVDKGRRRQRSVPGAYRYGRGEAMGSRLVAMRSDPRRERLDRTAEERSQEVDVRLGGPEEGQP